MSRSQVWWCTPVILALGMLRPGDGVEGEFEASLGLRNAFQASPSHIVRPTLQKRKIEMEKQ
jgi:hypothetical protein